MQERGTGLSPWRRRRVTNCPGRCRQSGAAPSAPGRTRKCERVHVAGLGLDVYAFEIPAVRMPFVQMGAVHGSDIVAFVVEMGPDRLGPLRLGLAELAEQAAIGQRHLVRAHRDLGARMRDLFGILALDDVQVLLEDHVLQIHVRLLVGAVMVRVAAGEPEAAAMHVVERGRPHPHHRAHHRAVAVLQRQVERHAEGQLDRVVGEGRHRQPARGVHRLARIPGRVVAERHPSFPAEIDVRRQERRVAVAAQRFGMHGEMRQVGAVLHPPRGMGLPVVGRAVDAFEVRIVEDDVARDPGIGRPVEAHPDKPVFLGAIIGRRLGVGRDWAVGGRGDAHASASSPTVRTGCQK